MAKKKIDPDKRVLKAMAEVYKSIIRLTITEQSHRCQEFGYGEVGGDSFTASNGFRLSSCHSPEYRPTERILFVKGRASVGDNTRLRISESLFNEVARAIAEYNGGIAPGDYITYKDMRSQDEV